MIKVIKPGKDLDVVYQGQCPHCECVIQCEMEDFEVDDQPGQSCKVKCPMKKCGGAISIDKCEKVPRDQSR